MKNIEIGDQLPELVTQPITRGALALFAGASGDHNLHHIDSDFAKEIGAPDVFAQGMLSMAYLGRLLTQWVSQERIKSWRVRFISVTPLHVRVIARGEVVETFEADGRKWAKLAISARTDAGVETLSGEAIVEQL